MTSFIAYSQILLSKLLFSLGLKQRKQWYFVLEKLSNGYSGGRVGWGYLGNCPKEVFSNAFEITTPGHPPATINLKILLDTRVPQSIWKYSWTPACDSQLENTLGHPRATVNLKILLDNRVRQSIRKYSWAPACDSQLENTPWHPRATVN